MDNYCRLHKRHKANGRCTECEPLNLNESPLSPTCSTAELERKADYVFAVLEMVALGAAKKGRYNSGELKEIAEGITERLCR